MIACDGVRNSQTHFLEVSLVESLLSSVCFLYVNHIRQTPLWSSPGIQQFSLLNVKFMQLCYIYL